jgi:hypothetical protein
VASGRVTLAVKVAGAPGEAAIWAFEAPAP